jgi:YegS/Rv2252/BmrU family lipid kinase
MKSSIVLISNPVATRASERKIATASYYLQSKGFGVEIFFTEKRGDAESLARQALVNPPSLIIAAGGDGTFNEVINGIAGSDLPMAILPLGTTNVLAKEIGIPEHVKGALEIALRKKPQRISLGRITFLHDPKKSRYFCLMAGIGFDGEAVFRINERIKKIHGKGAYILSGLQTLVNIHPEELTFTIDGKPYSGYSAIIGNAAKYGGNFKITPDAQLSEPFLHACIFKGKTKLDIIKYVLGIITGKHLRFKDIVYVQGKTIEVNGTAHIQIDGDYLGVSPVGIDILPNALNLIF